MAKAKTQGFEWLYPSLMAFNGSGYADMSSSKDFLDSYIAYKSMRLNKANKQAINLASLYRMEALGALEDLLTHTYGASRKPAEAKLQKHQAYRDQIKEQTNLL